MRRLSLLIVFLGLLSCSEVFGHESRREEGQAQNNVNVAEQVISGWAVDKAKSTLAFSGIQSGEPFTGSFSEFDARINFDPDDLANASVVVTINMNSAETDDAESSNALPGKEWFYIRKFPVAKFAATDFKYLPEAESSDSYVANGNLSIRGITQNINLPFTLKIENGSARMDAQLDLNRTTYKVGTGMWASEEWVEHIVSISVHLEAVQIKASQSQ